MTDCHYPDWAGLHFFAEGAPYKARIGEGAYSECSPFTVTGPTSKAIVTRLTSSVAWSLGINPVGWTRYGLCDAASLANALADGGSQPGFEPFAPILDLVRENASASRSTARRLGEFLADTLPGQPRTEPQVVALHEALRDASIGNVEGLVEKVGVSRRTLERLASQAFGFPPKTLLRRQRFLRSLGKFTIDPGRGWSASLDAQYVDQAHFVHDFRSFMNMTPSEYAQMQHPILSQIFGRRLGEHAQDGD